MHETQGHSERVPIEIFNKFFYAATVACLANEQLGTVLSKVRSGQSSVKIDKSEAML